MQGRFHPIRIGDAVAVFALDPSGRPFFEGRAVIEAKSPRAHHYRVRFLHERIPRTRFINPDWQDAPQRSLTLLREFLRTADFPRLTDFFPDPQGK